MFNIATVNTVVRIKTEKKTKGKKEKKKKITIYNV